jgi:hypothetical protein
MSAFDPKALEDLIGRLFEHAEEDKLDDLYSERGCAEREAATIIERLRDALVAGPVAIAVLGKGEVRPINFVPVGGGYGETAGEWDRDWPEDAPHSVAPLYRLDLEGK